MKRRITAVAAAVVMLLAGVRICLVNQEIEYPDLVKFQMGEEAGIGRNIFRSSSENMNGYSVTAEKARIMTYEEYLEKYGYSEKTDGILFEEGNMLRPEMIYEVDILVKNQNKRDNENCGISFLDYKLAASDFMLSISSPLYWIANDIADENRNMTLSFRLQPGTEMRFHLPFYYSPDALHEPVSTETVRNAELWLQLSLYPEQRQIRIKENETGEKTLGIDFYQFL